ncbi:phosphoribosylformylglycinamidine cyclo-ligase [bacterium]|jgi:phosphoribosylformylglycinamidine cyclo-ligase|nr:phosphoribosylformylglycinamidine cyclo-ligase [bacterium]
MVVNREKMTYKDAGVDIDLSSRAVERIKKIAKRTHKHGIISGIGGFGGLYELPKNKYEEPVLVSSIDGVGTKLKVAVMAGKHDTVGMDIVNHCVNDIVVQGARPLFFMDYVGMGKLEKTVFDQIIDGIVTACDKSDCVLLGGETAEMPGLYGEGEYDLVGCITGIVDKKKIIEGKEIKPGDKIIGLQSTGLHTNGYSLARKVLFVKGQFAINDNIPELGRTVAEELLMPHKSYGNLILSLLEKFKIKGMAHITGGGFVDNIPRMLPGDCSANIFRNSWKVLPIFGLISSVGNIDEIEMYRTFNCGIGMVIVVEAEMADDILAEIKKQKEEGFLIGEIAKGNKIVNFV